MEFSTDRRIAIATIGAGLAMSGLVAAAHAAADTGVEPSTGKNLREFSEHLASIPRRRDYKSVPMIADKPDLWDAAALSALTAYNGGPKHVWDHTDIAGSWLNGMRNTLNAQTYSFNDQISYASRGPMARPISHFMISPCGTNISLPRLPAVTSRATHS